MGSPYKYRLRPGFGSGKLLLEFILDRSDTEFGKDLMAALREINPKVDAIGDLWMNDEVLLKISSDQGPFLLSRDIWDLAFITAEKNQPAINHIDQILNNSDLFEKEEAGFSHYQN